VICDDFNASNMELGVKLGNRERLGSEKSIMDKKKT
jgi:hypothetical protein